MDQMRQTRATAPGGGSIVALILSLLATNAPSARAQRDSAATFRARADSAMARTSALTLSLSRATSSNGDLPARRGLVTDGELSRVAHSSRTRGTGLELRECFS